MDASSSPRLTEQLQFEASIDQTKDRSTHKIAFGSLSGF